MNGQRSRFDAVMPYAPAFVGALTLSSLIWLFSVIVGAPRVWPGTILGFIQTFAIFSYLTWSGRRSR